MYKKLLFFAFVTAILTLAQFAAADYTLINGTPETVWAAYSRWLPANGNWPAGWRTQGWYKIEPGQDKVLKVPQHEDWVYIRVINTNGEVKPPDHATGPYPFWIHRSKPFTTVETNDGALLKSNLGRLSLETSEFYQYRNGGSHTIVQDLPARQIYNQAINSVIWIHTGDGLGSGVLIDKQRRLAVTNEHVTAAAETVGVVFPYRHNGQIQRNRDFYLEDNFEHLYNMGYITEAQVIAKNVRNDLAIIRLNRLPLTAYEIKHDFNRNVEDSMRQGDKVHILGNPDNRLWNWTTGDFTQPKGACLPSGGACLVLESDIHGGNSGGPVLNGQGMLVGIITATDNETAGFAAPSRNIRDLLNTLPANLGTMPPPQRTYPKRVFKIRNNTGVTVPYEIKWSSTNDWQPNSLETGFIRTHPSSGQNIPSDYPQIRFDHIAGDQQVTYRTYKLDTALFREGNNNHVPTYFFRYNRWGDRLDLVRDINAAPSLSKAVPKETELLSNYPNPFNPETWIPYQLSKSAEVTVNIHAADGRLIRTLALGHQPAGVYQSKSRAAYWDGKNKVGEPVASGVYFYTLKAGDFTATRKMLIRK